MARGEKSDHHIETENNHIYGYRANSIVQTLIEEIAAIRRVKDWAEESNISESSLNRVLYEVYGQTPGEILTEIKYEKVISELARDIDACAFSISVDSGFSSEDALRMFLRRRFDTNLSSLREQVLIGNLPVEWTWLNGSD